MQAAAKFEHADIAARFFALKSEGCTGTCFFLGEKQKQSLLICSAIRQLLHSN